MKFSDFKAPMTVYHARVNNMMYDKEKRRHPVDNLKYFVLKIDDKKKQVFASCNGFAPAWYKGTVYKFWQLEKPTEEQLVKPRYKVA